MQPLADRPALAVKRSRLLELLRVHAFQEREVVLSSGRTSNFYIDCKQVSLDAEGAYLIGQLFHEAIDAIAPDAVAVGGLTLGADPLVCAVSAAAWARGVRWTGFLVRKEPKRHGLQHWLEGPFIEEGTPVALVDDVLTSGGSLVQALERARAAGGVVTGALVVIDRGEGGRETVEAALDGAPLHALFTARELLAR
jgi:orotate phosphoribosyltransferase